MSEPHPPLRFLACGDAAVTVEFGSEIDPAINARVLALDAAVNADELPGLIETVPTYRSLMVQFDPLVFDYEAFEARVRALVPGLKTDAVAGRRWKVPVVYGGEFGIDLDATAARHGLTPAELIDKHAGAVYRVYMIGFMPGFTYLGGLDPSIATPRRVDPRPMTPAGCISIGGIQALIAGQAMPSGWHILGRTPVRTFMAGREPAFLTAPGDEVVFEPTDASRWEALEKAAAAGEPVAELVQP
ncbi:MAG TPA: 5-oxoprolinase subunit PxpB [Hyphomicrobiaceae bacterium]|nr:5-oxoprolinase subunit PxpB [Hyphomicrobiaceae bacterium]